MPRANRVAPTGERFATAARGLLMGNRGCLVDAQGGFTRRRWTTRAWICCRLDFRGRQRPVAPPGRWTALFFMDEATALAAGHRPCGECRHSALIAFKRALGRCDRPVGEIDAELHAARLARPLALRPVAGLPDGAMVLHADSPWLRWRGALHRWTPSGYETGVGAEAPTPVLLPVITPAPMLAALAGGYAPLLHPSLGSVPPLPG